MSEMEKLLTVIVPVYNMQSYLSTCLDSLVCPGFSRKLEVLVILDGSTDRSGEIAREYESRRPDLFRVVEKENAGHGSAINLGIQLARGKYLKVLDGDDWVDGAALGRMLRFLSSADADVVWTNFYWVYERDGKRKAQRRCPFPGVQYGREYFFADIAPLLFMKMHSMTLRTEMVRSSGMHLDEHCYYVDVEYALYPVPFIKTIVFLDEYVYQYRIGRQGQSMTLAAMRKNRRDHERVLKSLLRFYEQQQGKPLPRNSLSYLEREIARVFTSQVKIYLSCPCSKQALMAIKKRERLIRERYPRIYRSVRSPEHWALRLSGYLLYRPAHFLLSQREKRNEL